MKIRIAAILCALLALPPAASAGVLEPGEKEVDFAFSYNDVNPDGAGSSVKTTALAGSFGYMLTEGHEVGGRLAYRKVEVGNADADSTQFGAFYHYNFRGGEMLNPYLGGSVTVFSGDLGDLYDNAAGVEGGVKVWPWANAGFRFGLSYEELFGSGDSDDASSLTLFGGVGIKF